MSETRTGVVVATRKVLARAGLYHGPIRTPAPHVAVTSEVSEAPSVPADEHVHDLLVVGEVLAREARLLDERRWDAWLDLWAEGARYAVPTRSTPSPEGTERKVDDELTPADGVWWFDETKDELAIRVAKLRTGKAWAEEPPSRTRRFVSNIEVSRADGALHVRSNILVVRSRRDRDRETLVGSRRDRWRRSGGDLRLEERIVSLDDQTLAVDNLMLFL